MQANPVVSDMRAGTAKNKTRRCSLQKAVVSRGCNINNFHGEQVDLNRGISASLQALRRYHFYHYGV